MALLCIMQNTSRANNVDCQKVEREENIYHLAIFVHSINVFLEFRPTAFLGATNVSVRTAAATALARVKNAQSIIFHIILQSLASID